VTLRLTVDDIREGEAVWRRVLAHFGDLSLPELAALMNHIDKGKWSVHRLESIYKSSRAPVDTWPILERAMQAMPAFDHAAYRQLTTFEERTAFVNKYKEYAPVPLEGLLSRNALYKERQPLSTNMQRAITKLILSKLRGRKIGMTAADIARALENTVEGQAYFKSSRSRCHARSISAALNSLKSRKQVFRETIGKDSYWNLTENANVKTSA
jgi:hypothetical protein